MHFTAKAATAWQSHDNTMAARFSECCTQPWKQLDRLGFRLVLVALCFFGADQSAAAGVTAIAVQSPRLSISTTVQVTSPVHFEATAESDLKVTGYVVYIDDRNVFQSLGPWLDAWVILAARHYPFPLCEGLGFKWSGSKYFDFHYSNQRIGSACPSHNRGSHHQSGKSFECVMDSRQQQPCRRAVSERKAWWVYQCG